MAETKMAETKMTKTKMTDLVIQIKKGGYILASRSTDSYNEEIFTNHHKLLKAIKEKLESSVVAAETE